MRRVLNILRVFIIKLHRYHPYWHKYDAATQAALRRKLIKKRWTLGMFEAKYRQPEWCNYPEALSGPMGCWKLDSDGVHSLYDCMFCDELKI